MRVLPRTCLIRGFCSCVDCIRDQFSCKTLAAYSSTNFKTKKKNTGLVPLQRRASGRLRRPAQGAGVSTARLRRPAQSAGAVPLTSRAKRWRRDAHELQPRGGPNVPRQRRASGRLRRPAQGAGVSGRLRRPAQGAGVSTARLRRPAQSAGAVANRRWPFAMTAWCVVAIRMNSLKKTRLLQPNCVPRAEKLCYRLY